LFHHLNLCHLPPTFREENNRDMEPASPHGRERGNTDERTDTAALKTRAARLSVGSNTFLVIAKLAVGFALGSVSIISEAIHSGIDLIAAVIAYFSVRKASQPADEEHYRWPWEIRGYVGLIEAIPHLYRSSAHHREAGKKLLARESTFRRIPSCRIG
jgi:Co/Zn/Cd efflux system component